MMKMKRELQQNLFTRADANSRPTLPAEHSDGTTQALLQALLSDLIAAPRLAPAVRGRMDEVE